MSDKDLIGLDELTDLLRGREGPARPENHRRRAGRRRILLAAAVAAAVAAGVVAAIVVPGGGHKPAQSKPRASSAAACAAAVEWHGTMYVGNRIKREVARGSSLGDGTLPSCSDGGGTSPAQSVALFEIKGIPPEQAVGVAGEPNTAYLSPGWLSQIPGTPLHDLLYGGSATEPNERTECEPGHTTTAEVRARVRGGGEGGLTVTLLEPTSLPRANWIFPDAQTVVTGGGSPPRVEPGDVIRAEVLVCRHADDARFLKLVATRLWLGG